MSEKEPSINTLAGQLVDRMVADAAPLRIAVSKGEKGETIIDAGKAARGGIEAGLRIAEICLGGLGTVELGPTGSHSNWPFQISVRSTDPVIACLASQYAGWALSHGEGKGHFLRWGPVPAGAGAQGTAVRGARLSRHATRATLVLEGRPPAAA